MGGWEHTGPIASITTFLVTCYDVIRDKVGMSCELILVTSIGIVAGQSFEAYW
jgi:hypothetical protein